MEMARCDDQDFYDVSDAKPRFRADSSPTWTKTVRIRVPLTTRTAQISTVTEKAGPSPRSMKGYASRRSV
jgi:hypothetical protein